MKLLQYVLLGLILFCLNACSVRAEPLRVISYNLESNSPEKTNPRLVAEDLQLIPPADIWGLTEVGNENDASIFHNAISQGKSHYGSILGKTGGSDRLQIIYNTQGLKLIVDELPYYQGEGIHKLQLLAVPYSFSRFHGLTGIYLLGHTSIYC